MQFIKDSFLRRSGWLALVLVGAAAACSSPPPADVASTSDPLETSDGWSITSEASSTVARRTADGIDYVVIANPTPGVRLRAEARRQGSVVYAFAEKSDGAIRFERSASLAREVLTSDPEGPDTSDALDLPAGVAPSSLEQQLRLVHWLGGVVDVDSEAIAFKMLSAGGRALSGSSTSGGGVSSSSGALGPANIRPQWVQFAVLAVILILDATIDRSPFCQPDGLCVVETVFITQTRVPCLSRRDCGGAGGNRVQGATTAGCQDVGGRGAGFNRSLAWAECRRKISTNITNYRRWSWGDWWTCGEIMADPDRSPATYQDCVSQINTCVSLTERTCAAAL